MKQFSIFCKYLIFCLLILAVGIISITVGHSHKNLILSLSGILCMITAMVNLQFIISSFIYVERYNRQKRIREIKRNNRRRRNNE